MKALVLDTETTGLISTHLLPLDKQSEVIEFYGALVDLADGTVLSDYGSMFKPSRSIPDEVVKITHITDDIVKDAPPFRAGAPIIKELIETSPLVIAHNASFDMEMIQFEYERMKQTLRFPHAICTVEQTIHLKGYRLSLMNLHELLFDSKFPEAHRAKTDTAALIRCCVELFKRGLI